MPCLPRLVFRRLCYCLLPLTPLVVHAQIESVTRITPQPAQFEKCEWVVLVAGEFADPYASAEVALDLELQTPGGQRLSVPGYWERSRAGYSSVWKIRFAPLESGAYTGDVRLQLGGRTFRQPLDPWTVQATQHRGFLRTADAWTLRFDNGEPFRGVGLNLGWESRRQDDSRFFRALHEHPRFNYDYMVARLAGHGGTFLRTWMCAWNLPLEWTRVIDTDRYADQPGRFNPTAIQRMDELVQLLEETGVYVMLTLDHAGSYIGGQWALNAYHSAQGGPATTAAEFFQRPDARARYRDRLRYLVARWGYSPHLAMWEFFNEVDHLVHQSDAPVPEHLVTAWHDEMARYLKQLDPQRRMVTTSISHRDVAGLHEVAAIDLHQRHIYGTTAGFGEVLRHHVRATGRPYVIGEYAYEWDWSKNFDEFGQAMDREFRRGLWRGLLAPTPVLPMSWWWEYFESRNQWVHFERVREVLDEMLLTGGGCFAEVAAHWEGTAVEVQAVDCAGTGFVWLAQETEAPVAGHVAVPVPAQQEYAVSFLIPASGERWAGPLLPSGSATARIPVTVPAQGEIMVIIRPVPRAEQP
jgi:hypothetical protein